MNLQYVRCYYCHSKDYEPYDSENGYFLVRCLKCGLLYVNPRPDETTVAQAAKTGQHQGDRKFSATGRFQESKVRGYLRILNEIYSMDDDVGRSLEWLDIGAGHGEFVMALKKFQKIKFHAKGLEPNIKKQRSAQKMRVDVQFFDLGEHKEKYDGISLLNVYSHLPNPAEDLGRWKGLLKRGGELLLQTGDSANLEKKDHHRPYFLPDHLSFASEEIVTNILKRLGFEIIAVRKYRSPGFPQFTFSGVGKELIKLVWPGKIASFNFFPPRPDIDMWIRARLIK